MAVHCLLIGHTMRPAMRPVESRVALMFFYTSPTRQKKTC